MNTPRLAWRIRNGNMVLVHRRSDGGLWLDAEAQPETSYGYPTGRVVRYLGSGNLERSPLPR